MAGDWIKMRIDLRDEPEVMGIARNTGLDRDCVVGKLLRVWGWLSRISRDGSATASRDDVDDIARHAGFSESMTNVGWLSETANGLLFPNFDRHNSQSAKVRAENTRRQNMSRFCRAKSATREEKRRVEKNTNTPLPPKGGSVIEIPPALDTPEVRKAFDDLVQHRREKKKPVTPTSAKKLFARFIVAGPVRFVEAIEHSIANGWTGVFEPQGQPKKINPEEFFAGQVAFACEDQQ